MVFQPAPGAASVTLTWRDVDTQAHLGENVLTFAKSDDTDFTQANLILLIGLLATWYDDYLRPVISNQVKLDTLTAKGLDSQTPAFAEGFANLVGTVSSARMPANVSLAVAFKTEVAGRTARGRTFMPPLPSNAVTEDSITPTYAAAVIEAYTELTAAVGPTFKHIVLSRYFNGTQRLTATYRTITTYGLTDQRVDTRRKRITSN